jgi:hypothetical protein
MYRTESKPPTCLACGSPHVTPETSFDTTEGDPNIYFETRVRPTGFLAELEDTRQRFNVDRAQVCLACGHVMFFLSPSKRRELERRMAELKPMPPREE